MRRIALTLTLFLAAPLSAQQPAPPGANCQTEAHRAFDFWLGSWTVSDSTGKVLGTNDLTQVASGCGMVESWVGAGGAPGTSLNFYDPADGKWHQHWTGSDGTVLDLVGGIEDGNMVLTGERPGQNGGKVIHRVTWSRESDGRVRQFWQASTDGGATWIVAFDGYYARRTGS